jgi:hypothetical protein
MSKREIEFKEANTLEKWDNRARPQVLISITESNMEANTSILWLTDSNPSNLYGRNSWGDSSRWPKIIVSASMLLL